MVTYDDRELIAVAVAARKRAYAPYSNYAVGAAIRGHDGRIWSGCNIENISYGLTVCAERVALGKMVSEGCRRLERIAVATEDGATPCGSCLQALREFGHNPDQVRVFLVSAAGDITERTLRELLPYGFASSNVGSKSVP